MALLNYTTEVPVERSVSQIQIMLVARGAQRITMNYGDGGRPASMFFDLPWHNGQMITYKLEINIEGVRRKLYKRQLKPDMNKVYRVAWRILKDWAESQLAMVDAELATTAEMFLPYAVTPSGQTMYESLQAGGRASQLLLSQ